MDYDQADEIIARRGGRPDCVICGANDWYRYGPLRNLLTSLPGVTAEGELLEGPGIRGGLTCFTFMCGNCGHVRLHAENALAAYLEPNKESAD